MRATENVQASVSTTEVPELPQQLSRQQDEPYLPHSCKCGKRWAGGNTAHCPGECHLSFSTARAFDMHRKDGHCRPPAEVGLVERDRVGYSVWGRAGEWRGSEEEAQK